MFGKPVSDLVREEIQGQDTSDRHSDPGPPVAAHDGIRPEPDGRGRAGQREDDDQGNRPAAKLGKLGRDLRLEPPHGLRPGAREGEREGGGTARKDSRAKNAQSAVTPSGRPTLPGSLGWITNFVWSCGQAAIDDRTSPKGQARPTRDRATGPVEAS